MRRLSPILGSLLVLALAVPVSAASVDRFKVDNPIGFSDEGCGFYVFGLITIDKEYEIDRYDNAGNLVAILITGQFVADYQNPANGKSLVETIPGSLHVDLVKGTFVIVGRNGIFSHIYDGRLDLADGTFTGHVSTEICDALA